MKLEILNTRDRKKIRDQLKDQYGCDLELDYVFLKSSKYKIYLTTREVFDIDHNKLRTNAIGLYFAEEYNEGLRLSLDGSQLVGPHAKKNVVEISKDEKHQWLKGYDIDKEGYVKQFVIVKSGNDYLGCAKHKNDRLFNHVPKSRRIRVSD